MDKTLVVKALKTASAKLNKFESESQMLKSKIAELTKKLEDSDKEAKAGKLAMRLTLDEDVIREVFDKTASLKNEDLAVVEKAMQLDLARKVASIGDVDKNDPMSDMDAASKFKQMILSLKK